MNNRGLNNVDILKERLCERARSVLAPLEVPMELPLELLIDDPWRRVLVEVGVLVLGACVGLLLPNEILRHLVALPHLLVPSPCWIGRHYEVGE